MQLMASEGQTHGAYAAHLAEFYTGPRRRRERRTLVGGLQQASMAPSSSIKQIVLSIVGSPASEREVRHETTREARSRASTAGRFFAEPMAWRSVALFGRSTRALAWAQSQKPVFGLFICTANGVVQQYQTEPEKFWPTDLGPLTTQSMQAFAADRCTGILADTPHICCSSKGVNYPYSVGGCGTPMVSCNA